jgi:hypothetical protein
MTLKDQLETVKKNWLIILAILVIIFVINGAFDSIGSPMPLSFNKAYGGAADSDMAYAESSRGSIGIYPPIYGGDDFAPEEEERKITKSASLSTEVERSDFEDKQARLKASINTYEAILLNENVYTYGDDFDEYKVGSYSIRVETENYAALLDELKSFGEVTSFSENADDITGQYISTEKELEAERARLERYKEILAESSSTEEKLNIADRIFDQERRIKYLEDALLNQDKRIEYTSIYFTLQEEQSDFAGIAFTKFGELIRSLVNSLNSLLNLIFVLIPYAIALLVIWVMVRMVRGRKVESGGKSRR